jgi:3',5'-cyclic AMP phosphodiesterase CpdA
VNHRYRILEIADPHFTECHFTGTPAEIGEKHALEILEVLRKFKRDSTPFDILLISGDLTFSCRHEGFDAAVVFIEHLMSAKTPSGRELFDPTGLIVIPGNHDINLGKRVVVDNLSLPIPKAEAEKEYRKFLSKIHRYVGEPVGALSSDFLSMLRRKSASRVPGLVVMALNSCRVERDDARGWGWVGMDQIYDAVCTMLQPLDTNGPARTGDILVAVTHHNLLPIWDLGLETLNSLPEDRKFSITMDAGSAIRYLADIGAGVLLHGHTHVRSDKIVSGYGTEDMDPMYIVGCGTLGFKFSPGAKIPMHHFHELEITAGQRSDLRSYDFLSPRCHKDHKRTWRMLCSEMRDINKHLYMPKIKRLSQAREFEVSQCFDAWVNRDTWVVLGTKQIRPADWDKEKEDLCARVMSIQKKAKHQVMAAIEDLFMHPPTEREMLDWELEQFLAHRRL